MSVGFTKNDKKISRDIHKLFWRANLVDKLDLILWVFLRPPALLISNILIPFVVAYGLQAIINKDFIAVTQYAWQIFWLGIAYVVLWGLGGVVICRNGKLATEFIQKEVFTNYLEKDYEFYSNT